MTLNEAIKHAEEVADGHDRIKQIKAVTLEECKCANEHRQLAEWLRELKEYRKQKNILDKIKEEIKLLSNSNPSYWHSGDMVEREEVFEIIDKYDFIVGSKEIKRKLMEILPEEANIVCSPYIEHPTMVYAVEKFDIMDLLS